MIRRIITSVLALGLVSCSVCSAFDWDQSWIPHVCGTFLGAIGGHYVARTLRTSYRDEAVQERWRVAKTQAKEVADTVSNGLEEANRVFHNFINRTELAAYRGDLRCEDWMNAISNDCGAICGEIRNNKPIERCNTFEIEIRCQRAKERIQQMRNHFGINRPSHIEKSLHTMQTEVIPRLQRVQRRYAWSRFLKGCWKAITPSLVAAGSGIGLGLGYACAHYTV